MPTPGKRRGIAITAKRAAKTFARNVFGLDVSSAKYGLHNPLVIGYSVRWLRRFMHFQGLLEQVRDVDGAIVECGVGPGRSLFDFSLISDAIGRPRRIFGYDTFTGIPDATAVDGKWNEDLAGTWDFSQDQVRENLQAAGLDAKSISNITLVEGELRTTLPAYDAGPIALLHLDVDIYESYKAALQLLYGHVAPGGVIAFDEYRQDAWPGATKAIDEFFEGRAERIVRSPVADRHYAIKCG